MGRGRISRTLRDGFRAGPQRGACAFLGRPRRPVVGGCAGEVPGVGLGQKVGGRCYEHRSSRRAPRRQILLETQRSSVRIIQSPIGVKFWAKAPPSCSAARPASCLSCGVASREPGRSLTIVGHGVRHRDVEGPEEPARSPETTTIATRRYRCTACGAVLVVVPCGVGRGFRYTLEAIAYALSLWGCVRATADQARRAVSTATARGFAVPEQWSSLRRWTSAATRLFGSRAPRSGNTLRERAARLAAWLASYTLVPTGQVPQDAFFGGRMNHAL
jgi:hypothetical protein